MDKKMNKHENGFTLVELMIVVAIIGILAMIALPSYQTYIEKTNLAHARTAIASIYQAVAQEKLSNPASVNSQSGLSTFVETRLANVDADIRNKYTFSYNIPNPAKGSKILNLYIQAVPKDNSYKYHIWTNSDGNTFKCKGTVGSVGPTRPDICGKF